MMDTFEDANLANVIAHDVTKGSIPDVVASPLIAVLCGLTTLIITICCSVYGKKMGKLIPFIFGILGGYAVSLIFTLIGNATGNDALRILNLAPFTALVADGVTLKTFLSVPDFTFLTAAKGLAEIAIKEGADAICHGCTGKGNDQVRFELTLKHFCPDMPIIAPWREWDIKSREEEIDYAEAHNIPLKINRETNYSKDKNLWHLSHEGLDLEDTGNEPQYEKPGFLEMGVSPIQAPDVPTYIELEFDKGVPVALDGKKMSAKDIILALNELGGKNGIGLLDIVENRLVGMKCRGVYETPGGTILYKAHSVLESICLDKMTLHEKQKLAITYAELVYNGQWFTPLREALAAFVDKTQETVTGKVRLKLYKGNMINAGVWSDYSLYSEEIATFGESDYNQADSAGFINLYGLPIKVKAMVDAKNKNK